MSFLVQPRSFVSAYRPIKYRCEKDSSEAVESVFVEVIETQSDSVIAEFVKPFLTKNGSIFRFEFDVQSIVQRRISPFAHLKSEVFGELGEATQAVCPHSSLRFKLRCAYQFRNLDNLLETESETFESAETFAVGLSTNSAEGAPDDLFDTYQFDSDARFLTDAKTIQVSRADNYFLSFVWNPTIDQIRLRFRHKDGSQTTETITLDPAGQTANSGSKNVVVVGCGPVNLESAGVSIPESVESYEVTAKASSPQTLSHHGTISFELIDSCAGKRVYFLNRLGGADAFTFDGLVTKETESKSERGRIPLAWDLSAPYPHNPTARGAFRAEIEETEKWALETRKIEDETAEWLRQLSTTPEAYFEQDGVFIPVVIRDGKVTPFNSSEEVGSVMKIEIELSSGELIQRN